MQILLPCRTLNIMQHYTHFISNNVRFLYFRKGQKFLKCLNAFLLIVCYGPFGVTARPDYNISYIKLDSNEFVFDTYLPFDQLCVNPFIRNLIRQNPSLYVVSLSDDQLIALFHSSLITLNEYFTSIKFPFYASPKNNPDVIRLFYHSKCFVTLPSPENFQFLENNRLKIGYCANMISETVKGKFIVKIIKENNCPPCKQEQEVKTTSAKKKITTTTPKPIKRSKKI